MTIILSSGCSYVCLCCVCGLVGGYFRVGWWRGDISCITYHRLFDLPSFIFSAKKPDITGSLYTLTRSILRPESGPCVCVCVRKLSRKRGVCRWWRGAGGKWVCPLHLRVKESKVYISLLPLTPCISQSIGYRSEYNVCKLTRVIQFECVSSIPTLICRILRFSNLISTEAHWHSR